MDLPEPPDEGGLESRNSSVAVNTSMQSDKIKQSVQLPKLMGALN